MINNNNNNSYVPNISQETTINPINSNRNNTILETIKTFAQKINNTFWQYFCSSQEVFEKKAQPSEDLYVSVHGVKPYDNKEVGEGGNLDKITSSLGGVNNSQNSYDPSLSISVDKPREHVHLYSKVIEHSKTTDSEKTHLKKNLLEEKSILILQNALAKTINEEQLSQDIFDSSTKIGQKAIQFFSWCHLHQEQLAQIKNLDLSNKSITHLPDEFFHLLPNLTILNLSSNELEKLPGGMGRLAELVFLNLSNNPSLTELPNELAQSQVLIDITNTNITDVPTNTKATILHPSSINYR